MFLLYVLAYLNIFFNCCITIIYAFIYVEIVWQYQSIARYLIEVICPWYLMFESGAYPDMRTYACA